MGYFVTWRRTVMEGIAKTATVVSRSFDRAAV